MAEDAAQRFGIPVERTPEEALMEALWAAAGDVKFYQARVAELPRDHLVSGTERITRRTLQPGTPAQVTEEVIVAKSRRSEWVALLNDARRHYFAVAAECARLGIQQRLLDRAAQMGEVFFEAMALASQQAGLTAEQREALIDGLPRAVASITGEVITDDDLSRTARPRPGRRRSDLPGCHRGLADKSRKPTQDRSPAMNEYTMNDRGEDG